MIREWDVLTSTQGCTRSNIRFWLMNRTRIVEVGTRDEVIYAIKSRVATFEIQGHVGNQLINSLRGI